MSMRLLFQKSTPVLSRLAARKPLSGSSVTALNDALGGIIRPHMAAPNNHGLHGFAARHLSSIPCPHAAAKISCPTIAVDINRMNMKLAPVDSIRGASRNFSSSTTIKEDRSTAAAREFQALVESDRRFYKIMRFYMVVIGISGSYLAYCKAERRVLRDRQCSIDSES